MSGIDGAFTLPEYNRPLDEPVPVALASRDDEFVVEWQVADVTRRPRETHLYDYAAG